MQLIYDATDTADFVVLASPVIFGNLTGKIIDILSRLQCYFKGDFATLPKIGKKKKGAIILTAGGSSKIEIQHAIKTAEILLKIFNVENPVIVTSLNTDKVPAQEDIEASKKIDMLLNTATL